MLAATAKSSPLWSELSAVMLLIASFWKRFFCVQYQDPLLLAVATTGMSTSLDGPRKGG